MDVIHLNSIDSHELIAKLASGLDSKYSKKGAITCTKFNNSLGSGEVSAIAVSKNCTAIIFDVILHKELLLKLTDDFTGVLNLLFCLEGSVMHSIEHVKKVDIINFRQNAILNGNQQISKLISFPVGVNVKLSHIIISGHKVSNSENDFKDIRTMAYDLVKDINLQNHNLYLGRYCSRTANHVKDMMSYKTQSFSDIVYKEAAILNILASQVERYQEDYNKNVMPSNFRSYELDNIIALEAFIKDNLSEKLTVEGLGRISGLSPLKLQNGFKFLFNTSVNAYITDRRMELAAQLLENDDYNISEVVYKIGYTSRSYFSKIFKAKFGISPSKYFQQIRINKTA